MLHASSGRASTTEEIAHNKPHEQQNGIDDPGAQRSEPLVPTTRGGVILRAPNERAPDQNRRQQAIVGSSQLPLPVQCSMDSALRPAEGTREAEPLPGGATQHPCGLHRVENPIDRDGSSHEEEPRNPARAAGTRRRFTVAIHTPGQSDLTHDGTLPAKLQAAAQAASPVRACASRKSRKSVVLSLYFRSACSGPTTPRNGRSR